MYNCGDYTIFALCVVVCFEKQYSPVQVNGGVTNMKKLSHSRANFILLILMTMWTTIILIAQAIPSLKFVMQFINSVRYEIIGGYVDELFIQKEIVWSMSYNILYTLTYSLIIIFLIITTFKPKIVKILGIIIIAQNIVLLSLLAWNKLLINELNNTILIDIKVYLGLTILTTIIFVIISNKPKMFYLILSVVTLLQCFNTIGLVIKHVNHIGSIYVIFQCFSEVLVLIPYWIVLLLTNKTNKHKLIN